MISQGNHSILDFWTAGIDYSLDKMEQAGKSIVRPSLVDAVEIHRAHQINENYRATVPSINSLRIIHARMQTDRMPNVFNISYIADPFRELLARHKMTIDSLIQKLPKSERMMRQIIDCFNNGLNLSSSQSKCANHYRCQFEEVAGSRCMVYENRWETINDHARNVSLIIYRDGQLKLMDTCRSVVS